MYSSQRTAAIYNLISEKNPMVLSPLIWDVSLWVPNGNRDSRIMFTSTNGAQSVFAFLLYFILLLFVCFCFLVIKINM